MITILKSIIVYFLKGIVIFIVVPISPNSLSTTAKTIIGAINELNITPFTYGEIANEVFNSQMDPIDLDEITQSDIDNIFE